MKCAFSLRKVQNQRPYIHGGVNKLVQYEIQTTSTPHARVLHDPRLAHTPQFAWALYAATTVRPVFHDEFPATTPTGTTAPVSAALCAADVAADIAFFGYHAHNAVVAARFTRASNIS